MHWLSNFEGLPLSLSQLQTCKGEFRHPQRTQRVPVIHLRNPDTVSVNVKIPPSPVTMNEDTSMIMLIKTNNEMKPYILQNIVYQ